MESLDFRYLGELVRKAQFGDSNAFAELYTATYKQQFLYAFSCLKDEELAREALKATYVEALSTIHTLQTPDLFVAWINRLNFRACSDIKRRLRYETLGDYVYAEIIEDMKTEDETVDIDGNRYVLSQLFKLPLTESSVLLQYYFQKLTVEEVSENLDMDKKTVKHYIKTGRSRLKKLTKNMV